MKKLYFAISAAALIPLLLAGCSSAKYVQTGGRDSVVNVDQVNIQDFMQASETMINSLLSSGALDRVTTPPAVIAISTVRNETGSQFDTDLLTKKIRIALNKSGKAVTRMNFGIGPDGKPLVEDPAGRGIQDEQNFRNDIKQEQLPDFTLSGKIIETRAKAGSVRQSTYSFQLSLAKGNIAVWEEEKEITKQGSRPSVGF